MKAKQITLSEENLYDLLLILFIYEKESLNRGHMVMHDVARSIRIYLRDNYYEQEN